MRAKKHAYFCMISGNFNWFYILEKFCGIKIHLNFYIFDSEILFLRIYTEEKVPKYCKNAPNAYDSLLILTTDILT